MQMQLHFPIYIFFVLKPPPPPPRFAGSICLSREVSGEFPSENAFHELPNGVLHCEDAVSIQLVVSFPGLGIGLKKLSVQSLGI